MKRFFIYFWEFFGSIWAHMGPARACMRAKSSRKIIFVFNTFCYKSLFLTSIYDVFYSFNVFFRFLAEIRFRTIMKLHEKASFGTKACSFGTSITLPTVPPSPCLLANHITLPGREIQGASKMITLPQGHHPAFSNSLFL